MFVVRLTSLGLAAALLSVGCSSNDSVSSSSSTVELTPCDPLAPSPTAISLGTVFAAGKSSDNTVFLVDQTDDYRVFASTGTTLVRQHVSGTGIEGETDFTFVMLEASPAYTLKVELGTGVRMGVLYGPPTDKTFVIGEAGEELTLVDDTVVAGFALQNFPGNVLVEYSASLPDGRWLVVTRPDEEWGYDDFRLFLGPPNALAERDVQSVNRSLDGGSTTIQFDLDGILAVASFPVEFDGSGFQPGPASLSVGSSTSPLTRDPNSAPPAGAAFLCPE